MATIHGRLGQTSSHSNGSRQPYAIMNALIHSPPPHWHIRSCPGHGHGLMGPDRNRRRHRRSPGLPDQETERTGTMEESTFPSHQPLPRGQASGPAIASSGHSSIDSSVRRYPNHHWNGPAFSTPTTSIDANAEASATF
jgi:hypothetical protein